jgi:F0F1-type ATP synthase delta subunit
LIGVLPRLLLDRDLFPSNEDIVDFAAAALRLEMTRTVEKRARHEIIGKIVCETDTLDEQQLTDLVKALEKLVGNKDRLTKMIEKKKSGTFSWNETLQELLRH